MPPVSTLESLASLLDAFRGEIRQRPPAHSAIWIDGARAYQRARRGEDDGNAGAFCDNSRSSRSSRGNLRSSASMSHVPRERISVRSRGTWARRLGAARLLERLVRTRTGPFTLDAALSLDELAEAMDRGRMECGVPAFRCRAWPPDPDDAGRATMSGMVPGQADAGQLAANATRYGAGVQCGGHLGRHRDRRSLAMSVRPQKSFRRSNASVVVNPSIPVRPMSRRVRTSSRLAPSTAFIVDTSTCFAAQGSGLRSWDSAPGRHVRANPLPGRTTRGISRQVAVARRQDRCTCGGQELVNPSWCCHSPNRLDAPDP